LDDFVFFVSLNFSFFFSSFLFELEFFLDSTFGGNTAPVSSSCPFDKQGFEMNKETSFQKFFLPTQEKRRSTRTKNVTRILGPETTWQAVPKGTCEFDPTNDSRSERSQLEEGIRSWQDTAVGESHYSWKFPMKLVRRLTQSASGPNKEDANLKKQLKKGFAIVLDKDTFYDGETIKVRIIESFFQNPFERVNCIHIQLFVLKLNPN